MAVPFLNSINLNKNEVENFKVFNYSGDPTLSSGGDFGYFWLDTTGSKRMKWWDGTTIRSFLDTSSTISGTQISGNITGGSGFVANSLTAGTYLTGGTYNGSAAVSFAVDATSVDTASKVVARDANGNFSGKTITATVGFTGPLTGNVTGNVVGNLTGNADTATKATDIAGGAAGRLVFQDGVDSTAFLAGGTNGQVLTYNTTGPTPQWTNQSSLTAGAVANALTAGTYLTAGGTFDGSVARTFAVDATSANTASKVVARDASGNFSAGTITASLSGNATTATTADKVANALTAGSYLTSGGTFDGAAARTFAVDATSANTASKVVARDASGNFSAGTITASLSGTATRANNLSGGDAGYIPYQSSTNNTTLLSLGSATQVLAVNSGGTAPEWINQSSLSAGTLSTARNFSITGKATASAVSFNGNNNVALDVTALSVAAGDISLTSGNFLVGNGSNVAQSTAKSSISLTGFGALTADLDIAGFNIINSGNVTTGSSASTLATKGYVDSVATGLQVKAFCDVATTANITLSNPGSITIDGVNSSTFTSGVTRILVKDQTTASENGIYIWNGSGSAMTRSTDMDSWTELLSAYTFVDSGTANADSGWVCTVAAGGTLGTTAITFTKFSQAGSYTAGNGLVQSGNAFHFAQSSNYTTGQIPYASGSTTIGFKAVTGTGDVVLATSPTLVTPALGTPTSGTLTNCTGLPLTTGVTGTLPVANGGTGAATFTAGRVLFGGTSAINTSANLFWDNTNSRLGIGTATPNTNLTIGNDATASATVKLGFSTSLTERGSISMAAGTGEMRISAGYSGYGGFTTFYTDGTLRATLDASGNLGVGAATPAAKLDVATTTGFTWHAAPTAGVHIGTRGTAGGSLMVQTASLNANYGSGLAVDGTYNSGKSTINLKAFGVYSGGPYSSDIAFFTSTETTLSEKMRLDNAGNLGLGVTPSAWISVYRAAQIGTLSSIYGRTDTTVDGGLTVNGYRNSAGNWIYQVTDAARQYRMDGDGHKWFNASSGTSGNAISFTQAMTLAADGNLGVGVTSPTQKIHTNGNILLSGGNGTALTWDNGLGSQYLKYETAIDGLSLAGWNNLTFYTQGTERMRLNSSGNLLLKTNGTASAPTIANSDNPDTGIYWPNDSDTLALAVGGSDAVYIDSSRNVGIGTSTPSAKVDVGLAGTGTPRVRITSTSDNPIVELQRYMGSGTDYFGSQIISDNVALYFKTSNQAAIGSQTFTTRFSIKDSGQLNFTGLAADPTGAAGDLYYSTGNVLKMHNGTAWQQLSRKYTVALNDGSVTVVGNAYTLTHNMGSKDITVSVRRTTDDVVVFADVSMPSTTTATVTFAAAITAANYVVTVIG